jgi:hypothetical protein
MNGMFSEMNGACHGVSGRVQRTAFRLVTEIEER